jgi:mannose-6-phosphate isomerase-like protein (cupin superfamily)
MIKSVEKKSNEKQRSWAVYRVLSDGLNYKAKRSVLYPGGRLNPQRPTHCWKHRNIVKGKVLVTLEDKEIRLIEGLSNEKPFGGTADTLK